MADIPPDIDDLDFDDWGASHAMGNKVLEMVDRLKVAHAVAPGAVATWCFEVDGQRYKLAMTAEPNPEKSR